MEACIGSHGRVSKFRAHCQSRLLRHFPIPALPKTMFRAPLRTFATQARQSLKIGLIPADGIGKEVIPVRSRFDLPKLC